MSAIGVVRENAFHRPAEHFPLLVAPEIVDHQESAAQQVLAQPRGFGVAQTPPAGLRGIDPGIVEEAVVGETQVTGIAGVDSRQPAETPSVK